MEHDTNTRMKTNAKNDANKGFVWARSRCRSPLRAEARYSRAGFALLFAILASSVLLSVAVAIWNIALREVILSSFGRESQSAFYAADTGAECAMYWDFRSDAFSTSTLSEINCGNGKQDVGGGGDANPTSLIENLRLGATAAGPCVTIRVTKQYSPDPPPRILITTIESRGHNTCDSSNPTLVERGLRVTY